MNQHLRIKAKWTEITHWWQRWHTHNSAPSTLSYLSWQCRVSQTALTVVFKIFHLYSHWTEEKWEWVGDRDRWGAGGITINTIMRQGPDLSLRKVGLPSTIWMFYMHFSYHFCLPQQPSKNSCTCKSLFFDLCSNCEPALPSTAGTEKLRAQKQGFNFNYRLM